jgi:hypothetical protein
MAVINNKMLSKNDRTTCERMCAMGKQASNGRALQIEIAGKGI